MRSIHVERTIPAPIDKVFDVLTDHAGYKRFPGVQDSKLLISGKDDPNGVGALRWVKSRPFRFEEEITAFERPARYDYLITKLNTPFQHDGGSVRLSEVDGGTHVDWTSSYSVPVPVIGGLAERAWSIALGRGFNGVLDETERITSEA